MYLLSSKSKHKSSISSLVISLCTRVHTLKHNWLGFPFRRAGWAMPALIRSDSGFVEAALLVSYTLSLLPLRLPFCDFWISYSLLRPGQYKSYNQLNWVKCSFSSQPLVCTFVSPGRSSSSQPSSVLASSVAAKATNQKPGRPFRVLANLCGGSCFIPFVSWTNSTAISVSCWWLDAGTAITAYNVRHFYGKIPRHWRKWRQIWPLYMR